MKAMALTMGKRMVSWCGHVGSVGRKTRQGGVLSSGRRACPCGEGDDGGDDDEDGVTGGGRRLGRVGRPDGTDGTDLGARRQSHIWTGALVGCFARISLSTPTLGTSPPKTDIYDIADRLWETADELRANSHLKAAEYSIPVLGLIYLKFADSRLTQAEVELAGSSTGRGRPACQPFVR
jgi:hypothetical protein